MAAKQDMGTGSVKKLMVKMAVPALVGQVVNLLYNIVDRIYIGHIPACLYQNLMDESLPIANYSHALITSHLSELMWLMEQIMWKSFDKRLAQFLLEEAAVEGTDSLKITHEKIANHMGTAREVVTRMLRYFQSENMVRLTRGTVDLLDKKQLQKLS